MAKVKTPKIGIAILTHDRPDVFAKCFEQITKFAPPKAKIVVVDDASKEPIKEATWRFERNVGIAVAKNKCLELLDDCEHLFLFDDDCYPIAPNWWEIYIDSGEPHLCYNFSVKSMNDNPVIFSNGKVEAFAYESGPMLYFHKSCLERVGGMDWRFGRWGWEHPNLANRIYNAGLTSFRFMGAVGANKYIYAADEFKEKGSLGNTTCLMPERIKMQKRYHQYYLETFNSSYYINYKANPDQNAGGEKEDVVITAFFNNTDDPMRGVKWQPDYSLIKTLIDSINGRAKLVILHDCFDLPDTPYVKFVKVDSYNENPYFARWVHMRQWLSQNYSDIRRVFCVDATDVEMINLPFDDMENDLLYIGDENEILGCNWMITNHSINWLKEWMIKNAMSVLLNCGLLGADIKTLMQLLTLFVSYYEDNKRNQKEHGIPDLGMTDMALMNFVVRTHFTDVVVHGRKVNTVFNRYQNTKGVLSWWKHK